MKRLINDSILLSDRNSVGGMVLSEGGAMKNNGAESYLRFLDGDRDALVDIIRDYRDGMILFVNTSVNDICLAEEIVQEVFVKLAVKKPKYSGKSSFKTWIYSICRYTAIDFLRKIKRRREFNTDELWQASDETDLEREYIREEQRIDLHRAMKKLNCDYRQVLYLIYFEGFDHAGAAKIMKKSSRQIVNLVYRAKIALKAELEKEGFVYEKL